MKDGRRERRGREEVESMDRRACNWERETDSKVVTGKGKETGWKT